MQPAKFPQEAVCVCFCKIEQRLSRIPQALPQPSSVGNLFARLSSVSPAPVIAILPGTNLVTPTETAPVASAVFGLMAKLN